MPLSPRTRMVNPKLGVYFGIFTSGFVSIAVLALILESLGLPVRLTEMLMLLGPIALVATIGLACFTREPLDYFASGRRVPEFYSGLGLALTAMGGTGLLAVTGAFFLTGFDALCLGIGGFAGFVVMATLLAPFYRKFGAYTVPSYLGRRFDSRVVRIVAAAVLSVPMALVLAAELRSGAFALTRLTDANEATRIMLLGLTVLVTLVAGGMRSSMWTSSAQSIIGLLALVVPAMIVAVLLTNLPIPQLSYGPVLRTIGRGEASLGLPIVLPPALAFDIPGGELQPIAKRFSDTMGSVGPVAFVFAVITMTAGVASAPWLLPRVAVAPGVYEARKSLGWATVLFAFTLLTLAPIAVFMRAYLLQALMSPGGARIPGWIEELSKLNAAAVSTGAGKLEITSFLFSRDAILLGLPVAAEMPAAAVQLIAVGVAAVALAAAGACAIALGNVLSEDVVNGLSWEPPADGPRLVLARIGLAAAVAFGALIALAAPADPFDLVLFAIALSGSTAFPVLVLSIWWKRLNAFGTLAGLLAGFSVAVLAIIAGEGGWLGLHGALAGALGIPCGFLAAIAVTLATPQPSKHVFELVRDIRVPGGDILYDREMLLLKRKKAKRV